jgi:hypothetical protein
MPCYTENHKLQACMFFYSSRIRHLGPEPVRAVGIVAILRQPVINRRAAAPSADLRLRPLTQAVLRGGQVAAQAVAALAQVHSDVLGQVVGAGEALFAQQALVGLVAVVRAPMTRQLVRAREAPCTLRPRAPADKHRFAIYF